MDTLIALVAGANRGIGKEVCRQLARQGIFVLLAGRNLDAIEQAAGEFLAEGLKVGPLQLDVTQIMQAERAAGTALKRFGRLDILINNAAVALDGDRGVFNLPIETFQTTLDVNLTGPLRLTQQFIPLLNRSKKGRIVNVSSGMGALHDMAGGDAAYRISKAALNALTRIVAQELSGTAIKVNAVCPGWVRTGMGGSRASRGVEDGARGIVWAATLPDDGPTGDFFRDGKPLAW